MGVFVLTGRQVKENKEKEETEQTEDFSDFSIFKRKMKILSRIRVHFFIIFIGLEADITASQWTTHWTGNASSER